jgi:TolA-binding protein
MSFVVCCAAVLFSSLFAFGAAPNASRPSAPSTAATRAKSGKTSQPSVKPVAGPNSVASLPKPAADPNSVVQSTDEPDSNSVLDDRLRSRLWKSRILPPDPNEDAEVKTAVQDLIQRLKTITTGQPIDKSAPSKPVIGKGPDTAKNAAPAQRTAVEQPGLPTGQIPSEPSTTLPPAAMEKLSHLMQDPNQVRDPLEMAELLFLNNRLAEAAVFYDKALALTTPNDPATSQDRAWILFQLGTSLRQTDLNKARDVYLKLIAEFPNSPWTELAKANGRLISWYQSTKPEQLIASPKP